MGEMIACPACHTAFDTAVTPVCPRCQVSPNRESKRCASCGKLYDAEFDSCPACAHALPKRLWASFTALASGIFLIYLTALLFGQGWWTTVLFVLVLLSTIGPLVKPQPKIPGPRYVSRASIVEEPEPTPEPPSPPAEQQEYAYEFFDSEDDESRPSGQVLPNNGIQSDNTPPVR
jgi:hypothetical protein